MKIAVVGAGIFGCSIALELDKNGHEVILYERESDILLKATKNNHNRIHYGYHYPRSKETAIQSLEGLLSFQSYYGKCIVRGFLNYYAIERNTSHVSGLQYREFCKEVGIGFKHEYPERKYLNRDMIDECYLVEEPIYDCDILKSIVAEKINKSGIYLMLDTDYRHENIYYDFVINCTYSSIDDVCNHAGICSNMAYIKQDVIVPIFKYKADKIGLTVMDGKFCSIMPRGNNNYEFLLYHAKYSVIEEKINGQLSKGGDIKERIKMIYYDAQNYFPFISTVKQDGYYRSDRAIPINNNDERLSEIITYKNNSNFISVFSGKVTTAVKIAKQVAVGIETKDFNSKILV